MLARAGESDKIYKKDQKSINKNGLCELMIKENQFMNFNDRSDYLQGLADKLFGVEYYLNDFVSTGIMYYDLLDMYNIEIFGKTYNCLMLNDEQNITQGLEENIHTDRPETSETDYKKADTTDRKIGQTTLEVNKQKKQIQGIVSQIGDRSKKETTITADIDGLNSKVSQIENVTNEKSGVKSITIENCIEGMPLKLIIYGNNTVFKPVKLSDTLYLSDDLYLRDSVLKVENKDGNFRYYNLKISDTLRQVEDVKDEFVLENKKAKIIRRINSDGTIKDNPVEEDLGTIDVLLYEGTNKISIEYYSAEMYIKYAIKNDLTNIVATKFEVNSRIAETSNSIMAEVKQKVDDKDITGAYLVLKINKDSSSGKLSADKIDITAEDILNLISNNEINLTSKNLSIKSDNFNVDKNGKMTATEGVFTGEINATNGTFKNIITTKGLIGMLHYQSSSAVGLYASVNEAFQQRLACIIACYVPKNFIIQNASITINHNSLTGLAMGSDGIVYQYPGNAESVKLYRGTYFPPQKLLMGTGLDTVAITLPNDLSSWGEMINNLGGNNGYTFSGIENKEVDITSKIQPGFQCFALAYSGSMTDDEEIAIRRTGFISASLDVRGYLPQL